MEWTKEKMSGILSSVEVASFKKLSDYIILLGGASIVSYALRTRFLGKMLRVIEVPHGNLSTIILRSNSLSSLKEAIIKEAPPLYPGVKLSASDIRVSLFTPPHFAENITSNSQCRAMEEGSYVLWTKMDVDIPTNNIDLKSFSKEIFAKVAADTARDRAIRAILFDIKTPVKKVPLSYKVKQIIANVKMLYSHGMGDGGIGINGDLFGGLGSNESINVGSNSMNKAKIREIEDVTDEERREIVDILVDDTDKEIVSLCSRYKDDPSGFRWHAVNILRTRKRFTGKNIT